MGDRTSALAGEVSDGVIFSEMSADRIRDAMGHLLTGRGTAGRPGTGDVVVFHAVDGPLDAGALAAQVRELVSAGATHVVLHVPDADLPLEVAARFVAEELRPLVD
jgi:hypothetical protein